MATASISRTLVAPTNAKKCTVSVWVKYGLTEGRLVSSWGGASAQFWTMISGDKFLIGNYTGSYSMQFNSNRLFRDPSAWYHFVVGIDTSQSVESDRMKLYVNGVQETSFSPATYPSLNLDLEIGNTGDSFRISERDSGEYWNGSMSHLHFIDGLQYAASDFGEFDATSGIWKIKTSPSVTYGNNGVFLKFEDRTNLDLDSSPNAHTMTTSGDLTATYDNPSNNFATMNFLDKDSITFSNGNTTLTWSATNKGTKSTLGMAGGKWYAECKATDVNGGSSGTLIGVGTGANFPSTYLSATNSGWGYRCQTGNIQNGAGNEAYGNTYTDGDIIGVAIDVDNGYVYMSKNGVWQDSGDPTSGASGTGAANNQPTYGAVLSGTQFFACSSYDTDVLSWNFGNGYFATTSTGTTEADDAGIGQFKYDVPTGYYALCTKNIKLYG
jgi:hypothetical protein